MQNCIMVALASRGVLTGTLDAVADGVGLATDDLRETLRQLVSERLIAVQTHLSSAKKMSPSGAIESPQTMA